MDTTKLIDAIAQADKADFDKSMSEIDEFVLKMANALRDSLKLNIISTHAQRNTAIVNFRDLMQQTGEAMVSIQNSLIEAYPEVKDLL